MAKITDIVGSELMSIKKIGDNNVNLIFSNKNKENFEINFNGYYFETKEKPQNHKVQYAAIGILGFQAFSELIKHHDNPKDYQQLFIKFISDDDQAKVELICAVNGLEIKKCD